MNMLYLYCAEWPQSEVVDIVIIGILLFAFIHFIVYFWILYDMPSSIFMLEVVVL